MAALSDTDKEKRGIHPLILWGLVIVALFAAFTCLSFYHFLFQDRIWASKVRKQIDPEETRAWAVKAVTFAEYGTAGAQAKFLLTNAPAYLLKKNYKRNPDVIVGHECIHLRYGGGMYSWGLTIGATNLPADRARGQNVELWSPGIYFWNQ